MSRGRLGGARVLDKDELAHSETAYEFQGHHHDAGVSFIMIDALPESGPKLHKLAEGKVLEMNIISPNKKWSYLTAKQKAPFVLRGVLQFALLAAALADIHRRPAEEINGSKWMWSAVALVNFMGIGPIAYFVFGRKHS
jgi:hypothetical protein